MSNPGESLKVLAIFHFIVGGLYGLYIAFTGVMTGLMGYFSTFVTAGPSPSSGPGARTAAMPPEVQHTVLWATAGIGAVITLLGLLYAAFTLWSGVCIMRRRSRHFSLIMASVNLLAFPFGTVLGIFAFILLRKEETVWWYAQVGMVPLQSTVKESTVTEVRPQDAHR